MRVVRADLSGAGRRRALLRHRNPDPRSEWGRTNGGSGAAGDRRRRTGRPRLRRIPGRASLQRGGRPIAAPAGRTMYGHPRDRRRGLRSRAPGAGGVARRDPLALSAGAVPADRDDGRTRGGRPRGRESRIVDPRRGDCGWRADDRRSLSACGRASAGERGGPRRSRRRPAHRGRGLRRRRPPRSHRGPRRPVAHAAMASAARALGRPAAAEAVADLVLAAARRRPLPDAAEVDRRSRGLAS